MRAGAVAVPIGRHFPGPWKTENSNPSDVVQDCARQIDGRKVPPYEAMVQGAIIGLVDVVGCEERSNSKWHVANHYGFVLAKPRALGEPIPCNGRLNFWEVPDDIARRILRELT